jgi:hypothetical protein
MAARIRLTAGVVLLALVTVGCGQQEGTWAAGGGTAAATTAPAISVAPSPTADPRAELLAAVDRLTKAPYHFEWQDLATKNRTIVGAADPAGKASRLYHHRNQGDVRGGVYVMRFGTEYLMQINRGNVTTDWYRVDPRKVARFADIWTGPSAGDPTGALSIARAATAVEDTGGYGWKGKVDLTKVHGMGVPDAATLNRLGAVARTADVEVRTEEGWIRSVELHVPAAGGRTTTYRLLVASPGKRPDIKRPVPVGPMPAEFYRGLPGVA